MQKQVALTVRSFLLVGLVTSPLAVDRGTTSCPVAVHLYRSRPEHQECDAGQESLRIPGYTQNRTDIDHKHAGKHVCSA